MREQKRKQVAVDTNAPTDTNASAETDETAYQAAVEEGKAITASMSGKQWALGDLADTVGKVYGEDRVARFAEEINFAGEVCTLRRYRDVCRAFPKMRGRPRFFASAQLLAALPDRFAIVERNPEISKAEAREIRREWRAENPDTATAEQPEEDDYDLLDEAETEPTPGATPAKKVKVKGPKKTANNEWSGHSKRWQAEVVVTANHAIDLAAVRKRCSPEQRRDLLAVLEPPLIETVWKASEALAELGKWLHKLADEASAEAIREGRVKTAPAPAQAQGPAHAGA